MMKIGKPMRAMTEINYLFETPPNAKHILSELNHINLKIDVLNKSLNEIDSYIAPSIINTLTDAKLYLDISSNRKSKLNQNDFINYKLFQWKSNYILNFNKILNDKQSDIFNKLQKIQERAKFGHINSSSIENSNKITSLRSQINSTSSINFENIEKLQSKNTERMFPKTKHSYIQDFTAIFKESRKIRVSIAIVEISNMERQSKCSKQTFDIEQKQEEKPEMQIDFQDLKNTLLDKQNGLEKSINSYNKSTMETIKKFQNEIYSREEIIDQNEQELNKLADKIQEITLNTKDLQQTVQNLLTQTNNLSKKHSQDEIQFQIKHVFDQFMAQCQICRQEMKLIKSKLTSVEANTPLSS